MTVCKRMSERENTQTINETSARNENTHVSSGDASFQSKSPAAWSVKEVGDWLKSFGFEKFVNNFTEEQITGDFLIAHVQDREIMEELGVLKKVQMKRLEFELNKVVAASEKAAAAQAAKQQKQAKIQKPSSKASATNKAQTKSSSITKKRSTHHDSEDSEIEREDDEEVEQEAKTKGVRRSKRKKSTKPAYVEYNEEDEGDDDSIDVECQEDVPKINAKKAKGKSKVTKTTTAADTADADQEEAVEFVERETVPLICFQEAKSAKAKCRGCEVRIERGIIKLGLHTFYAARWTVFPTSGWYHLQCGIALSSTKDEHIISEENVTCKGCKNKIITAASPDDENNPATNTNQRNQAETLVVLGGKTSKRDLMCQVCVDEALISPANQGLRRDHIISLEGYEELSNAMKDKVRFLFRLRNNDDDNEGSHSDDIDSSVLYDDCSS